ncbi:glycosyltransferase [Thiocystis minor]|uniref:glycosyltransferase n=1 Tax=Thiocystis minor TaxID=61597 RepID=UPI00191302BC|nr:glycosyltransferase [Thiocystis minor]
MVIVTGEPGSSRDAATALDAESHAAAACLGYPPPHFWRRAVGRFIYDEYAVRRVMRLIAALDASLLYAPSATDPAPVRACLGLIAREAVRRSKSRCKLAVYEIGIPLAPTPNRLLDITANLELKQLAMNCFRSRMTATPLDRQTLALNTVRTFDLPPGTVAVEAYWLAAAGDLPDQLPNLATRADERTARGAKSRPLISVVIRSMGRRTLDEALDSVAAQTYRHLEVILVDVKGQRDLGRSDRCGEFPLRTVSTGALLGRSTAANTGLEAASGDYVIFLDDDDWFMPEHVAGLMSAIETSNGALAAYAGIECRTRIPDGTWQVTHVFNQPHDPVRLLVENYLPIHAVLFSRQLIGPALRFDESFDVYEDWDFWIQLSALTDLVHVDHVSAVYRVAGDSGFGIRQADPMMNRGLVALFGKWRSRWSLEQVLAIADYAKYRSMYFELREQGERHAKEMAELLGHFDRVNAEAGKIPELLNQLDRLQTEASKLQERYSRLSNEKRDLEINLGLLNERLLTSEAHQRLADEARDTVREWLNLLGIHALSDVIQRREELARYRSFHGQILNGIAWTGDALGNLARRSLAPVFRFLTHAAHLAEMSKAFGPAAVLRSSIDRLRPSGASGGPRLADLWQILEIEALVLPSPPRPIVSVLIDHSLTLSEARRLLEELTREREMPPFEVLLRLGPRQSALGAILANRLEGIKALPCHADKGGTAWLTNALDRTAGDWLLLLSSTSVQPLAWMALLLKTPEDAPSTCPPAGAICAKAIGTDGRLANAGFLHTHDGRWLSIGSGDDPQAPEYNYPRQVDAGAKACLLLNLHAVREALNRRTAGEPLKQAIGESASADRSPADDFMFENLCQEMRTLGWSILYQPEVSVIVDDPKSDMPVHPSRPLNHRRRLLVVDAVMLTPDQDSGSLRMAGLLEIFLDLGWHVTFVPSNLDFCEPYGPQLQHRGVEVIHTSQTSSIPDFLERRGASFDLVILSRLDVASVFLDAVRRHAPQAWLWFDTVDLHFLREQRAADLRGDPLAREQANQRQHQEIDLMRRTDLTLVVSPVERDLLIMEAPEIRVEILSNIHDPQPTETHFNARDAIVFIGGFNHHPNVDAVLHYVADILPRIRAELGNVPTYIIGSRPPLEVLALDDPDRGLHVVGFIQDVTPYFARARLSIAPLRYGAGVKGKINMSMAYGVPVVATPCAAEGMFLQAGRDILIGEDDQSFADAVTGLYRYQTLWESIARHGLVNIATHFSRQTARATLERLLSERYP